MKKNINIFTCSVVAVFLILSAGCSYVAPGDTNKELVPISSIGVLPAQTTISEISEKNKATELETGLETFNSLLAEYFQSYQHISMISESKLQDLPSADSGKPLFLAREAGQQLHYDAILITFVERFQAREGSEYAVMKPASVAFTLKLLAVESGQVLWSADFEQTQQPLFENILPKTRSTGSGFRWLTAKQLASEGLTKKLNSCPYLRKD